MIRERISLALAVAAAVTASAGLAAQTKRPDFSGVWERDIDASKALTEKMGGEWRVAGARSGEPAPGTKVIRLIPRLVFTQSENELIIESLVDGKVDTRDVYKLDGTVSVNATARESSRSTVAWRGAAMVTSGTRVMDFSDVVINGQPGTDITETFVTTRTLLPDGTMHVESRTTRPPSSEQVSWSIYRRVKDKS